MEQRNLIIIGGGPAGYVAAIRARQLGAAATLIEKEAMGGTCLNRGCISMRALIRGTEFLGLAKKARDYGVSFGATEVDFAKMMARTNMVVRTHVGGVELLMKANGVEVLKGTARLLSTTEVEVQMESGAKSRISAPKIIIATGARPGKPAIPGAGSIITTDQALQLTEVPRSVVILGSGAIAFAFATIFARLGASVSIVEESSKILPGVDREIVAIVEKELKREKIAVHTGARLVEIRGGGGDENKVVLNTSDGELALTAQYVLAAQERVANTEGLGLDRAGVKLNNKGAVESNSRMETSVKNIFAAGDVAGEPMLTHVAFAEGKAAAENALGRQTEIDYSAVPRCINAVSEIAAVGLTEQEAAAQGRQVQVGRFPFAANAVATIFGERSGMVKIITGKKYGQILGVHIVGPHATDLIAEAVLAMKLEATPAEIISSIHYHPSLSEAFMEAAMDVTGSALHSVSQSK